jgi:outer membrane receptor protein involved in Fe transport
VRVFANLESLVGFDQHSPWLRGSRLTLSVTNLFDERVQVRDATGATPLAYQAAYLDPVGRTFRVGLRKVF